MSHKQRFFRGCIAGIIVVLGGCAAVGVVAPQSPSQELAYAYGVVAGLRSAAAQALTSGTLPVADAQKALSLTDSARSALDAGEVVLASGDLTSVANDLAVADQLIAQVQALMPGVVPGVPTTASAVVAK